MRLVSRVLLLWLAWCLAGGAGPAGAARPVTIAVVRDGPSWYFDGMLRLVKREVAALVGREREVRFRQESRCDSGWDPQQARDNLARTLTDPTVDLVLAAGPITSWVAAGWPRALPKPVIAAFASDPELIGAHLDVTGRSRKANFAALTLPRGVAADLETMSRLFKGRHLAVLVDAKLLAAWPEARRELAPYFRAAGFPHWELVPMGTRAEEVLAALGPRVRAVYLTPALRMSRAEQERLIQGLIVRRLPSYAMLGKPEVVRGVLAGTLPDLRQRAARRIALDIQQILAGTRPEELSSRLEVSRRLVINARTAELIGFWPDFELALEAEFVGSPLVPRGQVLTLPQAMRLAVRHSPEMGISRAERRMRARERDQTLGRLLPQVEGRADYQQIDSDRADASLGMLAHRQVTAGARLTQMIFDDRLISAYRARGRLARAARYQQASKRLEVMAEAGRRFLDLLSARALARIQRANLELVQKNLELARMRVRLGISGREEVFRLQAKEAQSKSSLFQAQARVDQARVALNRVLGVDLDRRWRPQEVNPEDAAQFYLLTRLAAVLDNRMKVERLRGMLARRAEESSPALKALREAIAAQEIEVARLERSFWLPSLYGSLDYYHLLDQDRGAAPPVVFTAPPPLADRDNWTAAVSLRLPLLQGGGRLAELGRARAELRRLRQRYRRARDRLGQQIRSLLYHIHYSGADIDLTRAASQAADKNLEVVTQKYARGTASLMDLLDAQNEALVRRQAAALAVYRFLEDYIGIQQAIAWFEWEHSRREIDALVAEIRRRVDEGETP